MGFKKTNTENSEILIVDDNEENIKVLGNILKINNYRLSIALSAKDALAYLDQFLPDLILLDVNMPEMNGFELCEKLKSVDRTSSIPIIFITAKAMQEDIMIGFELGAEDYIVKPFNPNELLARIQAHLELKKSRDLIQEQNKKLKDLNESKNKFFSIIAHDIRNPVSSIYGFAELLKNNYTKMEDAEKQESLGFLYQSVSQLKDMIEQLLEWGKVQMNKVTFQPEKFLFKDLVFEVFYYLKVQGETKKIKLVESVDQTAEITGDRNMIRSILINLISNSIKFTRPEGQIEVQLKDDQTFWYFIVKDNGVGMDEQTMSNLFKMDSKNTRRGTSGEKGTGIGLILSMEFAEKHGGTIKVASKLGEGSTFTVTIKK